MAWAARMTNQSFASVSGLSGAEFAAVLEEAKAADDSSLHEIMRTACDLLHILIRVTVGEGVAEWRYPRPGAVESKPVRVSPLDFARRVGKP